MALFSKAFLLLFWLSHTLSDDTDHDHTSSPLTSTVFCNDSDTEQCETVTVNSTYENTSEFSNVTTILGDENNSTNELETDGERNMSTDSPSSTQVSPSVPTTVPSISTVKVTTEPTYEMQFIPEDICLCDLTVDYCDINCCCDVECSSIDRQAFSHCYKRPISAPNLRYCYQTNFIFRNNTEFKMTQSSNGLFCIMWDNVPMETRYVKRKAVTKLVDFKKLNQRRPMYQWPMDVSKGYVYDPEPYRAGSVLWTISNTSVAPLVLPIKMISAFCETTSFMRYLVDWHGTCSAPKLECSAETSLSASTYYSNFFLIAAPQHLNKSQINYFFEKQECMYNICLTFDLFVCSSVSNTEECLPVNDVDVPIFDIETKVCNNTVKKARYRIYHNGTLGIIRAEAYFWLVNLNVSQLDIRQEFAIDFVWSDSPRKPFRRSGNPGYIFGKPVIAGQKVFKVSESEDEPDKEAILLSEDYSKWLTFPKPGIDNVCTNSMTEEGRISVNFGENLLTSCFIELSVHNFSSQENCSSLQRMILIMLLGERFTNVTEANQLNLYVSTFGDGNVEETGNWVPVLIENLPIMTVDRKSQGVSVTCKAVVSNMHVNIITSKVGLASNPQSKILGVAISFGTGQDIVFDCSPSFCSSYNASKGQKFRIGSSVSFIDVSKPPVAHFAEPPVYEVKLPYDFFYPFLSSAGSSVLRNFHCRFIFVSIYHTLWFSATSPLNF